MLRRLTFGIALGIPILGASALFIACTDETTVSGGGHVAAEAWEQISPLHPLDNELSDVQYISGDCIWAAGSRGTILRFSLDGSWQNRSRVGTNEDFTALFFKTSDAGWVVGSNGTILHTSNAGLSWSAQSGAGGADLNDITFLDNGSGWVVGNHGTLLTTDGGDALWSKVELGITSDLTSVSFFNDRVGCVVGGSIDDAVVLVTLDGGASWHSRPFELPPVEVRGDMLPRTPTPFAAAWSDEHTLHVGGQATADGYQYTGFMIRSPNAGLSWIHDINLAPVLDICFGNGGVGWSLQDGFLFGTTDGGESWERLGMVSGAGAMDFHETETGVAVGSHTGLLATYDGGGTWIANSRTITQDLSDIQFLSKLDGWVVTDQGLRRTSDGGYTWQNARLPAGGGFCFIDSDTGWAFSGYNVAVYFTSDGGDSWDEIASLQQQHGTDIKFVDATHGWLSTYSDIMFTSDGGYTWTSQKHVNYYSSGVVALDFADTQHGHAVSDNGYVFSTTDGGQTWDEESYAFPWYGVYTLDAQVAWVVGAGDRVLHTSNGGQTWEEQPLNRLYILYDVQFLDAQEGWACGDRILHTTDGGRTWMELPFNPRTYLRSVFFIDAFDGWVAGGDGVIFRTRTGGVH